MVLSGVLKEKNKILWAQNVQFAIMGTGNFVLGGISGGIADYISIVRNLISLKWEFKWYFKIFFIVIQVILTAIFNDMGIIGWLPTAAACIFTWCLDTKNEILLKILIMLAQLMWAIYDLNIKNYSTMAFDIATMISNTIGIIRIIITKKTGTKIPVSNVSDFITGDSSHSSENAEINKTEN